MNNLPKIQCEFIEGPEGIQICHAGPSLDLGPLPTFFYFALSGEESLTLDPFNQPVAFLRQSEAPIRVFSLTLPGHHPDQDRTEAMKYWADSLAIGGQVLMDFLEMVSKALTFLIEQQWVDAEKIAVGGLSRGAFIASHLAARDPRFHTILGFSPLTDLSHLSDVKGTSESLLLDQFSLIHLVNTLADKRVRFYIGNRDKRVGTNHCFTFIEALTEAAYAHHHRTLPIECIIFPSIGHKGHGTPPQMFQSGIQWLLETFLKI